VSVPEAAREPRRAGVRARVITVSTRASSGVYADRGGPLVVEALGGLGCDVDGPVVVPDGEQVAAALAEAVGEGYAVVVTTGGTGLHPSDRTPEMTRRVVETEVPGLAEAIRAYGVDQGVPTAALSRGVCGIAGRTLVVNLPGSTGGVRDGLAVLGPVLMHAVDQIAGGDHVRPAAANPPGRTGGPH
jgi:molybdenum cofactor synthesis domain-containing protein